jgi:titin
MYGSADTAKVMYGERAKGPSGMRRALTTNDRNGIQWIYGTSAPSAPVLSSPASGSTSSTLTPELDWQDTAGAASYGVQVSTSSTFATTLVNQAGLTTSTYTVPGSTLAWNTTYYWRVNAVNTKGSSAWSSVRNFKTATGPPPSAPSGLSATPVSSTRIDLGWNDNSDGETGFKIERRKGTGAYALIATVGPDITTYSNTSGLTASTGYTYRVRAYLSTLYSSYSNEADATTLPLPPAVPTLTSPASGTTVTVTPTLDWNEPSGATRYGLQVSTSSTFATTLVNQDSLLVSNYTVPDGTLNHNTLYYWRANAANAAGSTSRWSAARSFRTAP